MASKAAKCCYSELNIMGTVGFVHLQSFTDTWQKKDQDISAWNVLGLKKTTTTLTYLPVKMLSLCSPKQQAGRSQAADAGNF